MIKNTQGDTENQRIPKYILDRYTIYQYLRERGLSLDEIKYILTTDMPKLAPESI